MNDQKTAKLRMYHQLLVCLKNYQSAWESVPAFAKAAHELEIQVEQINKINPGLQADRTGVAEDKARNRILMVEDALRLSGVLQAYAHSIGSRELENSSAIARRDFHNLKEMDADDLALHIYELGQRYLEDLADFGYEQADLENFAGNIRSFSEKIGLPRQIRNGNKEMRAIQQACFDLADSIIQKTLDKLIDSLKKKNPDFWQTYQNARAIMRKRRKTATPIQE